MIALNRSRLPGQGTRAAGETRTITHRTRGTSHGPITRLISPTDLGERLRPFVLLDLFSMAADGYEEGFGTHPHSGIATLSFMMDGQASSHETTAKHDILPTGGVEWMKADKGVWRSAGPVPGSPPHGFQLWVALPPEQEFAPAHSLYLTPSLIPREGPVRVLLGRYGAAQSLIPSPGPMNYFAVQLRDGDRWRYKAPAGHTVAWVAVSAGRLDAGEPISTGELAVFDKSDHAIELVASGNTTFVLGSAVQHGYNSAIGYSSVHTDQAA